MFKIINKTNQTFMLTEHGYLYPYSSIVIKRKNEQLSSMEKKGLISIKDIK